MAYLNHIPYPLPHLWQEKLMPQYCDSKILEFNWFHWLLAASVPNLEVFRQCGLLWTKVPATIDMGSKKPPLSDPLYPKRSHCIALGTPLWFNSHKDTPSKKATAYINGKQKHFAFSNIEKIINLQSNSRMHKLNQPFIQTDEVVPLLIQKGYIKEMNSETTWHLLLEDVSRMCHGISAKFNLPIEEQNDLKNDALLQVTNKLISRRLVYTPGKAPVFNLLTTTIHRCMYSIMNRNNKQKQNMFQFASDLQNGILPDTMRSLRLQKKFIRTK